jgi:hypothetical protein
VRCAIAWRLLDGGPWLSFATTLASVALLVIALSMLIESDKRAASVTAPKCPTLGALRAKAMAWQYVWDVDVAGSNPVTQTIEL